MDFKEATRNIVTQFGVEVISEKRYVNILSDYQIFQENPSRKFLLTQIITKNYTSRIKELTGSTEEKANLVFIDCVSQILANLPFREEDVVSLVADIIEAVSNQKVYRSQYNRRKTSAYILNDNNTEQKLATDNVELMDILVHPLGFMELYSEKCSYEDIKKLVEQKGWKHQCQMSQFGESIILLENNLSINDHPVGFACILNDKRAIHFTYEIRIEKSDEKQYLNNLITELNSYGIEMKEVRQNSYSCKTETKSYSIRQHTFTKPTTITLTLAVKKQVIR